MGQFSHRVSFSPGDLVVYMNTQPTERKDTHAVDLTTAHYEIDRAILTAAANAARCMGLAAHPHVATKRLLTEAVLGSSPAEIVARLLRERAA